MKAVRIISWSFGIALVIYFLFMLLIVCMPYVNNYFNREDFNSERWKEWKESESDMSLRWNMISDLEGNYKLEGMTTEEVLGLLGAPDTKSKTEWAYYLGMTGHGIDTGTLRLTFERERVKSSRTSGG